MPKLIYLLIPLLISSCTLMNKITGKEKRDRLAREAREQFVADSLAEVARQDSLAKELARLDSIRVADSLAALPPPVDYDTVLVASLMRTPCYGQCPHYELRLYASGYATYEGKAHVKWLGEYEARLEEALVDTILARAQSIEYFNFADRYPTQSRGIEDFPLCITQIRSEDQKKIIYNRNDAPVSLVKYEKFIDKLFKEVDWQRKKVGILGD